jgi:hypothetical protein
VRKRPEQVIREYLVEHGDLDDVPVEHLLTTWRLEELTTEDRAMIGDALSSAGVRVEPPLPRVPMGGSVALTVERGPRPIREVDVARALVAAGALITLVSLWLPWVGWLAPLLSGFPFERQANAWGALGVEPWLILVAAVVAAATLLPADAVPESLRREPVSRLTWLALAFGVLAAGIALAYSFAPSEKDNYGSAEVGVGPLVALWASCVMTVGVWLSRPKTPP